MKIVIIGSGPSGLLASIFSKNKNNEVIVLEKNEKLLKKLLLTGNGKCNYFNDNFIVDKYYSENTKLLKEIINTTSKNEVLDFFNNIGIEPRIINGYYYPASNQAYSIYNALIKESNIRGVKVINNYEVKNIEKTNGGFVINNDIICDKVVIACGSKAYPKTGSTGDAYKFANQFNLKINNVRPGLVSLNSNDKILKELTGVRSEVKVTLFERDKQINNEKGEIQFTDYGLSGICIYNLSVFMNNKNYFIHVNFLDDFGIDVNNFESKLNTKNNKVKNRNVTELLEGYLNYKIVNAILRRSKINVNSTWDELDSVEKKKLAKNLTDYVFEITSTREYDVSQVCAGGISLNEVDIHTFESKKVKGLYFVGECLDATGVCGGYNLGFAFLSGMLAGKTLNRY